MNRRQPYKIGAAVALLAVFPVAWLLQPWLLNAGFTVCFWRTTTGYPCVFCGLTRAVACAMHGRWHEATHYNPLWPVAVILIATSGTVLLFDALAGKNVSGRIWHNKRSLAWLTLATIVSGPLLRLAL